jgi:hypothetical protein
MRRLLTLACAGIAVLCLSACGSIDFCKAMDKHNHTQNC